MNFEERCELLKQCRLKRIRNKELANLIEKSDSWISQFFNKPEIVLAEADLEKIKAYVASK